MLKREKGVALIQPWSAISQSPCMISHAMGEIYHPVHGDYKELSKTSKYLGSLFPQISYFNSSEQKTSIWKENKRCGGEGEELSQQMGNLGDLGVRIQMLKIGTALLALICNMCGTAATHPSRMYLATF